MGAMPFARTGRFTLTLRNDGSADVTATLFLSRASGSGMGCATTVATTGSFAWKSADLDAISSNLNNFSYSDASAIPIAANSTRIIRFEMASVADYEIDGDCVWNVQVNGNVIATLTVEDDEARPYIGPIPGPHPYGANWPDRANCLIDGKGMKIRRSCLFE